MVKVLFVCVRRASAFLRVKICVCIFFILLGAAPFAAHAQSSFIKGKVFDSKSNEAIAGASVAVKAGKTGSITNDKGEFVLKVNQSFPLTLIISYVGYKKEEIIISENTTPVAVALTETSNKLNEVVVVGYGTQRKRDITGSVTSFDAKNLEEKPLTRVEQALIGQMPGVQVRQQTGMLGAGLSIMVRGSGSVTAGTEPLYVIDGFPLDVESQNSAGGFSNNPLSSINPSDIESVQVLKDAAAAAIYGSRAANGVVIINTKRGQTGKAKISFNAYAGISKVAKKLDLLSPEEWVNMATEVANTNWVNSGKNRTADQTNSERRTILGLGSTSYNTSYMTDERWALPGHPGLRYVDWQDALFRTAPVQNYELSASGGNQNVHYFISGSFLDQSGTLIKSDYKNYGLRANIEANVNQKIKLGINLAPTYSELNSPDAEGKDNQLMKAAQISPVVEESAGLLSGAGSYSTYQWSSPKIISPYAYIKNSINLTKMSRVLSSAYAQVELFKGLIAKESINYNLVNQNTKKYVSDYVTVGAATERTTNPGKNSSGSYSGLMSQNFLNEATLSYNTSIGKHNVSAVAGISYNWIHSENYSLSTAGGYANDLVNTLNNAIANSSGVTINGSTSESNNTLYSYYGRLQYSFSSKYLFSASFRRDASSKFGANNRWGTFPSLSLGWRISDESFFKNVRFVNDLKLRASWGKAGNNNIGNYNAISTLTGDNYSLGGNTPVVATGRVSSGLANPSLKWETAETYGAGVDASVLSNRISLTFDVYKKQNKDLLLNVPVLAASGFTSSLQNIGKVENKGLEIGLNTINITSNDFQWSTNAGIAFNSNKVISLGSAGSSIEIPSAYSGSNAPYLLQEGLPMYSYYVTKVVGILTQEDMDDPTVAKIKNETVGDPKYFDRNGDHSITSSDRVVYGHPSPKYTWNLTNTFKYKNFDLSVQAYGQHGGSILSYLGRAIDFSGSTTANVLGIWRDRWTTQNQNYKAPRGKFGATYTVPYVTSDWIYSTDFWRIQNITLGYNLKTKLAKTLRLYLSAQNWFSKDKYKGGVNPEAQNTNLSGNSSYQIPGDYSAMPLSKTVIAGVNITF